MINSIKDFAKKPVLGICLGMQILSKIGLEEKNKWIRLDRWKSCISIFFT